MPENKPENESPNEAKNRSTTNARPGGARGLPEASQAARATRARAIWGFGFVLFVVALAGTWWLLKLKYDATVVPESFNFVSKFEKDGIPLIEAVDLDGKPFNLSNVKTPVVIVNFWASWCEPCVEEFPSMLKLVDSLKGKVTIVAVSMDDDEKDLRAFTKLFKVPKPGFEVLWDRDKKVMGTYAVGKLPESYIVGPDRKLIRKVLGVENWANPSAISYFQTLADKSKGAATQE